MQKLLFFSLTFLLWAVTASAQSIAPIGKPAHIISAEVINGTEKAIVEIGATGFNAFIANIDKNKNWKLDYKSFGQSHAYEGEMNKDTVLAQLRNYINTFINKGVKSYQIHFVVSSGALKNPKTTTIIDAITSIGYVVNKVTAQQEGEYALQASLPIDYRNKAYSVDMGSGNTKISYIKNGKITSFECPGAKYYENKENDTAAYNETQAALKKVPSNLRNYCFIIGGVPFNLAKTTRKDAERYTQLALPITYNDHNDPKLKSGLNIYRAISDNSANTVFLFDWDANFAIGFLLALQN